MLKIYKKQNGVFLTKCPFCSIDIIFSEAKPALLTCICGHCLPSYEQIIRQMKYRLSFHKQFMSGSKYKYMGH